MKRKNRVEAKFKFFLTAAVLGLAADLASKAWVERSFQLDESVAVMPYVWWTYVRNPGAAFSLFANFDASIRIPLFITIGIAAMVAIYFFFRSLPGKSRFEALALGLLAGGAIGNLVDRVRYGEVIDFIEVGVKGVYTWPVFNIADSCVFVGVVLLVGASLKESWSKKK